MLFCCLTKVLITDGKISAEAIDTFGVVKMCHVQQLPEMSLEEYGHINRPREPSTCVSGV